MMDDMISRQAAIEAVQNRHMMLSKEKVLLINDIEKLPSALGTNLAEVGTDCISRQAAIDAFDTEGNELIVAGKENADAVEKYLKTVMERIEQLPSAQPDIIRCKDCKHWVPGYITDNDDFIPPKCREWQQMVGHSSDDYCSLAERRDDG